MIHREANPPARSRGRSHRSLVLALLGLGLALLARPGASETSQPAGASATKPAVEVRRLAYEVIARHPHQPDAFTQGLLFFGGQLLESTGLYGGRSSLRRVEIVTGRVLQRHPVSPKLFAEGLARVGTRLIQLTWKAGIAIEYHLSSLRPTGRQFRYRGEGWGLCFDGTSLWMSNGSDQLTVRDPESFAAERQLPVRFKGRPVAQLNELECVGEHVYANVWQTDVIVRIAKETGKVDGVLDASRLFPGRGPQHDVLNGIAHDPATGRFYLTGKLWPTLFEVEIREQ